MIQSGRSSVQPLGKRSPPLQNCTIPIGCQCGGMGHCRRTCVGMWDPRRLRQIPALLCFFHRRVGQRYSWSAPARHNITLESTTIRYFAVSWRNANSFSFTPWHNTNSLMVQRAYLGQWQIHQSSLTLTLHYQHFRQHSPLHFPYHFFHRLNL